MDQAQSDSGEGVPVEQEVRLATSRRSCRAGLLSQAGLPFAKNELVDVKSTLSGSITQRSSARMLRIRVAV
jgi:hypothetical protein